MASTSDNGQPRRGDWPPDPKVAARTRADEPQLPLADATALERALLRWESEGGNLGPHGSGSDGLDRHSRRPQEGSYELDVRVKRAYEPADPSDGYRVLVDRLWPRGVSRLTAALNEWDKSLAPSKELREWFGHEPSRFAEFRRRYLLELRDQRPRLAVLRRRARAGTLTLVYAARDREHNDAIVLADVLRRGLPEPARPDR